MIILGKTGTPVGAAVYYRHEHKSPGGREFYEPGSITSYNDHYVFVRYVGDNISKATNYADLFWPEDLPDGTQLRDNKGWWLKGSAR